MKNEKENKFETDEKTCCICKKKFYGFGNNPSPVKTSGRCCDECNFTKVLPERISQLYDKKEVQT